MTSLLTGIPPITFYENNELNITPSPTSSMHDFDFLAGHWKISNYKLAKRLCGNDDWMHFEAEGDLRLILQGKANIDSFRAVIDNEEFEGMTLRLFDPETRLWSIYWSDSRSGKLDRPVVGSFSGDTGYFFTKDFFDGKPIIMAFRWDRSNPDQPTWSQAFSPDNGKSWEWNWHMNFQSKKSKIKSQNITF